MLTMDKFTGINNIVPEMRLAPNDLVTAANVDIGLSGEISRRDGYSVVSEDCHKNLWQGDGFMLATSLGDLKKVGGATLYPSLGLDRVWYCNLPDGKTIFSNGLINGLTDGLTRTSWGVPIPASIGSVTPVSGGLFPGDYQYQITYVRLSDGAESGPAYSNPTALPDGGFFVGGLPVMAGHKINVYLTSHNGGGAYYAGSTTGSSFSFIGENHELVLPCRTDHLDEPPVGTVMAFWRGRVLVADGDTLWASKQAQWGLFDKRRDFKRFDSPITLIQPVNDGVYIGTEKELLFLAGTEFDKLQQVRIMRGRVVLGSGVTVPGERIKLGDGVGRNPAMICIADGILVAGFDGGTAVRLTEGRYKTTATEVSATFRMINGIPQYLAIPQ